MIAYTGDIHGDITSIYNYISAKKQKHLPLPSAIVILGDAGLNFYLDGRDIRTKKKLNRLGVDIFSIHGNHEARPETLPSYHKEIWNGGIVYVEDEFPYLKFAKDGEIYNLEGVQTLVIGGAYSVDKFYRLANNWPWWNDEQPSKETKQLVEQVLEKKNWKIEQILTHTCPAKFEPIEAFIPEIDQSTVDTSTEDWLDEIEDKTEYEKWYCGHWHIDKDLDNFHFVMNRFLEQ